MEKRKSKSSKKKEIEQKEDEDEEIKVSKDEKKEEKKKWRQRKRILKESKQEDGDEEEKEEKLEMSEDFSVYKWISWFTHGSQDSTDVDRLYLFPTLPSRNFCLHFYHEGKEKGEDRNIFVIKDGYVYDCFKGTPDEINNSLRVTTKLHPDQKYELPINQNMIRIVPLKMFSSIRAILIKLRRTKLYRTEIVSSLRNNDILIQKSLLKKVDFTKLDLCHLTCDDFKYIAFQLGQALALAQGKELYTKLDIIKQIPQLKPFLYRNEAEIQQSKTRTFLNEISSLLLQNIERVVIKRRGNYNLVSFSDSSGEDIQMNSFEIQSRGMIIDFEKNCAKLFYFPFDYSKESRTYLEKFYPPNFSQFNSSCLLHLVQLDSSETWNWTTETQMEVSPSLHSAIRSSIKKYNYDISSLEHNKYWFIFQLIDDNLEAKGKEDFKLFLIGARNRVSYQLLLKEEAIEIAKKHSFHHFFKT